MSKAFSRLEEVFVIVQASEPYVSTREDTGSVPPLLLTSIHVLRITNRDSLYSESTDSFNVSFTPFSEA